MQPWQPLLDFWFGDDSGDAPRAARQAPLWWGKSSETDALLAKPFTPAPSSLRLRPALLAAPAFTAARAGPAPPSRTPSSWRPDRSGVDRAVGRFIARVRWRQPRGHDLFALAGTEPVA